MTRKTQQLKTKTLATVSTLVLTLGGLAIAATPLTAGAASGGTPASSWHIGYYTPSNRTLSNTQAPSANPSIASLNFTNLPNTALLVTDQKAKNPSLLGDLSGKTTVTAKFTISGATPGAFTYFGDPDGSGQPAKVRLYFDTSNAGGFDSTHYWWSNPASATLQNGTLTVTANINDPTQWSDWNGQFGNTVPTQYAAAVSNVTDIGLSFGGGYFFENGVGTTDGSGTFTLDSYTVN